MGPKIQAAIDFVQNSKDPTKVYAAIGDLKDAAKIVSNKEGTIIKMDVPDSVVWREQAEKLEDTPPKQSKAPHKYG